MKTSLKIARALLAFLLLLLLTFGSAAQAETLLHDTNTYLTTAATTAAGAVGQGWVDPQALWSINGTTHTLGASTNGGGFTSGALVRPAGENVRDGRIVTDFTALSTSGGPWTGLRYQDANNYIAVKWNFGDNSPTHFTVYEVSGGTPTNIYTGSIAIAYGDHIRMDFQATGSTTIVYTLTVTNVTAAVAVTPTVPSDTAPPAALQLAGSAFVMFQQAGTGLSRVQTFNEAVSAAATSYTTALSAASGPTGQAVTLTYTPNGTSTATVTPAETGAAGTFSAATVSFSGTASVTDTWTPSATGTASFTSSATGLTSTTGTSSYTVTTPPAQTATNDANIYYSPGNWVIGASQAYPTSAGAYFKFAWTGTGLAAVFDTTNGAAPTFLKWSVDNGPYSVSQSGYNAGTGFFTFATGVASGSHTISVFFPAPQVGWTSASTLYPRILSYRVTAGAGTLSRTDATLTAVQVQSVAVRPNVLYAYGDSRGQGPLSAEASNNSDATVGFIPLVAAALNAEYGQIAFGGTGYTATYNGIPALFTPSNDTLSNWNKMDSAHTRSFTGVTHVLIEEGANDTFPVGSTSTSLRASVVGLLPALRAALPSGAKILVGVDFGGYGLTDVQAACTAYQISTPDANTLFLTTSPLTSFGADQRGISSAANAQSIDGLHPTEYFQSQYGAVLAAGITKALNAVAAGTTTIKRRIQ